MIIETVKREAHVGEFIVITDNQPILDAGYFVHIGDIFEIVNCIENDFGNELPMILLKDNEIGLYEDEYEVLLPKRSSRRTDTNVTYNNTKLTHEIIELQFRVTELERLIEEFKNREVLN